MPHQPRAVDAHIWRAGGYRGTEYHSGCNAVYHRGRAAARFSFRTAGSGRGPLGSQGLRPEHYHARADSGRRRLSERGGAPSAGNRREAGGSGDGHPRPAIQTRESADAGRRSGAGHSRAGIARADCLERADGCADIVRGSGSAVADRVRQRGGPAALAGAGAAEGDRHSHGIRRQARGANHAVARGKRAAGGRGRVAGHRAERLGHACAGHAGPGKLAARGGDRHRLAGVGLHSRSLIDYGRPVRIGAGAASFAAGSESRVTRRRAWVGRKPAAQPGTRRTGGGASGAFHGSAGGRGPADSQFRAFAQRKRRFRRAQRPDNEYRAAAHALSERAADGGLL